MVLENTKKSLQDLREQLLKLAKGLENDDGGVDRRPQNAMRKDGPGDLWSCKFNSGLFAVDWKDTKKVLEKELGSLGKTIQVVSPAKS